MVDALTNSGSPVQESSPSPAPSQVTLPDPALSPATADVETPQVVFEYVFGMRSRGRLQIERILNPDGTSRLALRYQAKSFDGTQYVDIRSGLISPELRDLSSNGNVVLGSIQTLDQGLGTERIQFAVLMPEDRRVTVIVSRYPTAELVKVGQFTWSDLRDIETRERVSLTEGRVRNFIKRGFYSLVPLTDDTPDPLGYASAGFHQQLKTIKEMNPLTGNRPQYQTTTFVWRGASRLDFNQLGNLANRVGQIIYRFMPNGTNFLINIRYNPETGKRQSIQMNGVFGPDGRGAVKYDIWSEDFKFSYDTRLGLITGIAGKMTSRGQRSFRVDALLSRSGVGERTSAALILS